MDTLQQQAQEAVLELIEKARLQQGDILVVGCSSSEIGGGQIGKQSSLEIAKEVFGGIYPVLQQKGIFLAAQCCEHLNRALIIEKRLAQRERLDIVNAVPQPKAGGSFATCAYEAFDEPVAVEHICAQAGMDIGDTLIGMHLQEVAVPLRLKRNAIGQAHLVCARTRPKFIGGERAHYDEALK